MIFYFTADIEPTKKEVMAYLYERLVAINLNIIIRACFIYYKTCRFHKNLLKYLSSFLTSQNVWRFIKVRIIQFAVPNSEKPNRASGCRFFGNFLAWHNSNNNASNFFGNVNKPQNVLILSRYLISLFCVQRIVFFQLSVVQAKHCEFYTYVHGILYS